MSRAQPDWLNDYERTKSEITAQRETGRPFDHQREQTISATIERLDSHLSMAGRNPSNFGLQQSEIIRRQSLTQNLRRSLLSAQQPDSRSQLTGKSKAELLQQTRNLMAEQDVLVESLDQGVLRLKGNALAINQEAKASNKLLSELETDVENTKTVLVTETEHADEVRKTTGTFHLYIIITLLFLLLIVLIAFGFS